MRNYTHILLGIGVALLTSAPLWAYQTDQGIESSIMNSYVFTNYLKGDNVIVHSQDGVVTLSGTVADENQKFLAQNTAENVADVKSVDNQLQVNRSMPAMYSDGWIGIKVKTALLFHRNVSAIHTHVDVKDGIVILSGEADNEAQKELAGEYAKDIDGVKGIINNIAIKEMAREPDHKIDYHIDDASITAQVKMTLLVHRSTSAIHTHVTTENGVVTLTGKANNEAEKSLVTKLVSDINGVKDIVNNMRVE
jgi:osmotically-inducible protein OsmY